VSARSALIVARARALSRMVDQCTISRPGVSSGPVDPVTGLQAVSGGTSIHSGRCFILEKRVQNPTARGVAGDAPFVEVATLEIPHITSGLRLEVKDIVVITAAPDHPGDVGRRFRITYVNPGTQLKAQQCQMEVITG
jgi:hypothetical protein